MFNPASGDSKFLCPDSGQPVRISNDWYEISDTSFSINFGKAAGQFSSFDPLTGQQYEAYIEELVSNIRTAFVHNGLYNGENFRNEYVDGLGVTRLRFTPHTTPNNGIPEIFMFEMLEGADPVVYMFVDND